MANDGNRRRENMCPCLHERVLVALSMLVTVYRVAIIIDKIHLSDNNNSNNNTYT